MLFVYIIIIILLLLLVVVVVVVLLLLFIIIIIIVVVVIIIKFLFPCIRVYPYISCLEPSGVLHGSAAMDLLEISNLTSAETGHRRYEDELQGK